MPPHIKGPPPDYSVQALQGRKDGNFPRLNQGPHLIHQENRPTATNLQTLPKGPPRRSRTEAVRVQRSGGGPSLACVLGGSLGSPKPRLPLWLQQCVLTPRKVGVQG